MRFRHVGGFGGKQVLVHRIAVHHLHAMLAWLGSDIGPTAAICYKAQLHGLTRNATNE